MIPKQYRNFTYTYDPTRDQASRWAGETDVQMSFGVAHVILDAHSEAELVYRIDAFWFEFERTH